MGTTVIIASGFYGIVLPLTILGLISIVLCGTVLRKSKVCG